MKNIPGGTVTFLFTDIQGSTKLWENHPAEMKDALAKHDMLLSTGIKDNGGYIFKTVGDAFCASFSTALEALNSVLIIQRLLKRENWGETPIKVRMSIHTGVAEERDGDYFGKVVNRTARLEAAGHGGQVLVSAASQELLQDNLPKDIGLLDLGVRRLKDLERSEHIYQLTGPGLTLDFPPLKTLDIRPNNLPLQFTSFLGRDNEIKEIKRIIKDNRLLTLLGPGGLGKTRIALQTAAELLDSYRDGVWFIDLSSVYDSELVVKTTSQVLNVVEEPEKPLINTLINRLKSKEALIILDNCEQVIESCVSLVSQILSHCADVKIMTTSREVLEVTGEHSYLLSPMSVPRKGKSIIEGDVPTITEYLAVKLFIERAILVKPDFTITNENAPALAQICCWLDGIPLAIELAASRIRIFSLEELMKRLESSLIVLAGKSRTAHPRQKTLNSLIDWSYKLLDNEEKKLFARLSVFADSWTMNIAEVICGSSETLPVDHPPKWRDVYDPDHKQEFPEQLSDSLFTPSLDGPSNLEPEMDVLDLMECLIDKSLVILEELDGKTRYRMLWTIRRFAETKLNESGELEKIQKRFLQFYTLAAEKGEYYLNNGKNPAWLFWLDSEYSNINLALNLQNQIQQEYSEGLRLASSLAIYCDIRGNFKVFKKYTNIYLEANNENTLPLYKIRADICFFDFLSTEDSKRKETIEKAYKISKDSGFRGAEGFAKQKFSSYEYTNDYNKSLGNYKESLAIFEELNIQWAKAAIYNNIGYCCFALNKIEDSIFYFNKVLDLTDEFTLPYFQRGAVQPLSMMYNFNEEYEKACTLIEQFFASGKKYNIQSSREHTLFYTLAVSYIGLEDYEQSTRILEQAEKQAREDENNSSLHAIDICKGMISIGKGEFKNALLCLFNALMSGIKYNAEPYLMFSTVMMIAICLSKLEEYNNSFIIAGFLLTIKNEYIQFMRSKDQTDFDNFLSVTRQHLGDDIADKLLKKGSLLSLDEAVALTVEVTQSLLDKN